MGLVGAHSEKTALKTHTNRACFISVVMRVDFVIIYCADRLIVFINNDFVELA